MCELFALRNILFVLSLGISCNHCLGNRVKIIQRFKRQSVKEGRCPSWAVIRNCSSLEQCIWDRDCSGSQKCCKSTCETRSCYEPILRIGPNEDACPRDDAMITSHKKKSDCVRVRTRFCFKSSCKRCCFHYSSCNPQPELLTSKDECRKVLCSTRVCRVPGEVCLLDKFNHPRCSCRAACPTPLPEENVCGTDGIPYDSACELNRTACILGTRNIKIQNYGNCHQNGVKVKVSTAHKKKQVLPAYRQGELTCRFEGDPVSITWQKVGLQTLPNRMVPRMDKLNILDVDMQDSGIYKCMAYDGFPTAEAAINVTVNGPSSGGEHKLPVKDCLKPQSIGYCKRYAVRWYYDGEAGVCRPFAYGGCGGNKNNFPSQEACSFACSHAAGDICNLPKIEGPCRGFILQWFYNSNSWRCEQFVYGGCGGNTNRFSTKMMCQERCVAEPSANSPCLQQQLEARRNKHLGVFVPNCRPDGEYEKIQCHKSVCFCADEDGREVPNTRVSRHKPLNCIETSRKVAGFTACQIAQQNSTDLSFGSSYPIRCKQDGSYEEVQCSGSNGYCWCVDKNGVKLNGTETRGALKCPAFDDRLTLCQRQYLENSRSPRREQEYVRCHEDGSFEEIQCNGTICFCVDLQNGWIVKDTSISALFGEPRCGDTGYGLTLCQRMHQESLVSTFRNIYVPQCTVNGSFVEIQCYGPSNECWCVDRQGRELPGTKVTGPLQCVGVGQPLTECQKEYQKNLRSLQPFLLRYVPRCSADGSYQQVQCAGGVCYCVTPQGKQIPGSKTFNSARQPNCTEPDSNITPCEKKRREAIFSSKKFIPFCKPDGSWSEIQCERSSRNCWCVDSGGKEVPGTRSRNLEKCPDFDCFQFSGKLSPCRRRLMNLLKSTHPSRHPPWCRVDGSYNPMQCYGSYCYCVQENGNEQPGTKISVVVGKPVCTYTSGTVTDCQRRYQEATLPSFQGNFVPQCKLDGQYEAVQCQGSNGECWCVDQDGKEISGTRTTQALKCPVSASSLTICQQQYIEYAKNPAPGKMLPRCKKDGTFDPLQCQGPYCFCVDNEGNQIEGTSLPIGLGKPKCGRPGNETLSICQKQRNEALQLTGKHFNFIPTCKRNGRFEEIQCLRATSECWCVDESGKEISGTRTTGLLKCPIAASPLSQCQKEYQEIIRSWILPGPYIPQCTHEGQYELIQCERQYCFCVNEYGVELFGSRVDIVEGKPKCHSGGLFLTLCQKQFQDYLRHPVAGRFEPRCGKDGAFQDTQCHENVCFCVSREGNEIPSTRQSIAMGKPVCYRPERSLTKCQKQLQEAIHLSPERKRFVPRCKFNGDFEEIQCHNSSGLCWCVDKKGNEVLSTGTNQTIQCPFTETNSLCWTRYQQIVRSGVAGTHVPWCKPDGSFSPLQIQGSQFFCVNDRGDEVPGTSVDVGLGKPDCRAATYRGYILTPCQRERSRRSYLPLVAGRYVPRCKVDGTYDEVQCDMMLGQCWCVNRDGKEMNGSRSEGVVRCPNKGNLTSCQKRQKRAKELSNSGSDPWNFVPRCREDGGYYEVQCHVSTGQCWCVDENGNERWGTIVRGLPNCSANIMACQRHRIRALGLAGNPPPATYVPFCKDDGSYGDVQCHSFTGLCWCVDKKGREILGTRKWGRPRCSTLLPGQKTPLDLGILIDVSDTSVSTNWTRMLNFVSSIVASFDISASGSHVGLITFSSDAEIQLYFNTLRENNLTVENVTRAVNNVIPKKGMSRFDVAMSLAEEELFNEATGMRHEIPKAILLVTSGQQSRNQGPYTTLSASTQGLKDKGVFIFAVGIGTKIIVPELMDLASDYRNVFVADHPSALQSGGTVLADVIRNKTKVLATKDRICNLPPEPGQLGCLASISAFYFEAASGECHSFVYSGCGGNANNFPSYEKCMNFCKGVLPSCIEEKKRLLSLQVDHFSPKCKTNGRYEDVQCYGKTGYCWCVDEYGREVPGTRTMGFPICNLATVFGKLTPCLEERRKALGMVGVPSVGRFVPECNQDGEYANIQCFGNTNFCWCSDKNGYEIAGTHRWGTPECPAEVRPGVCPFISDPTKCSVTQQTCSQDSDCPGSSKCCDCGCVRQCTFVSLDKLGAISSCVSEHIKSLSSSCPHFRAPGRFYPKCKPDGGYEELQCNEPYGVCWCVDKDGNEIPGSRRTGKPNCTTQVAMTPCQREHRRALSMVSRSSVGMFIASCQLDGSYDSIQCHNVTGYCWCVDSNGSELAGTRQWGKPNCTGISKTSTVCQSRYDECLDNAPPGHFIPRCKIDGSYKERQCLQSTGECWCVDKNGNELPGTRSREMHDCSLLAWLSPCQINRRQALGLKSVPVMGLHAPECKADGGFNNIQCQMTSGYCWCVDQFGTEVQGSRMKGRPSCDKKLACKKESEGILEAFPTPPPGMFVPQCSKDGGYQATQCHASTGFCWCVDEYGNELTGTRMRGSLNCTALKHPKLSLCHSGYNKATEVNERGHHVPQCEPGGSYKQIQCYSASGECWCVDREGKEKLETRRIGKPHCQVKDSGINCELPPDAGPCKANMPSWFFNTTAGACAVFIYGGCNGNGNRFSSYSDCQDSCHGRNLTLCELQREINRGQSEDFIPGCTKDGEFEEVQCQVSSGECWCVDKAGIEIVDSRMLGLPSCNLLDEGIGSRGAR